MDWFELIIFAILVGAGLLFGDKNKRRGGADRERAGPGGRGVERGTRQRLRPGASSPDVSVRSVAERIFEQLQREREAAERRALPEPERDMLGQPLNTHEAVSLEQLDEEPTSLEVLQPDDEARHERFHEQYVTPLRPPPRTLRHHLRLTPRSARQAVVWMEVLGPPKGLQ